MAVKKISLGLLVFLSALAVYIAFSNFKPSIYNHHVYLAKSFLEGRIDTPNPPPHFNDVATLSDGKTYSIYGPMGAILLVPFVAFMGLSAPEGMLNIFLAALGVFIFYKILNVVIESKKMQLTLTTFYAFGTLHFFSAVHNQTWWYVYVIVSLFILASILEVLTYKRAFLIGLLVGFAYLTRLEAALALVFPLFVLNEKGVSLKQSALLLLGFTLPFALNSLYNFMRFGNIFDTGYANFVTRDPSSYIPHGLFSLNYLATNFHTYFLKGPEVIDGFPYFRPPWIGMSVIITTPAFLYALRAPIKDLKVVGAWVAIFLMALPSLLYFLSGWTEFGWKHSTMFTPFLAYLVARGMGNGLNWLKVTVITLSIVVQLWGVLWWRLAGWFY